MITFENKGLLDPRAITTFGVSSKDNKDTAIGYFGTGLKYAIAILLRCGQQITIITGGKSYEFGVEESHIRNDTFQIVTMNGQPLGFTTELGKNWELWQAYRELYCNMLDEQGKVHVGDVSVKDNHTYIIVEGQQFEEVHNNNDKYFLDRPEHMLVESDSSAAIWKKDSKRTHGIIFYRGVRVGVTDTPALFDYDIRAAVDLTEDRTLRNSYTPKLKIAKTVVRSTDEELIEKLLLVPGNNFEKTLDYNSAHDSTVDNSTFLDIVGKLRDKYKDTKVPYCAIELHKRVRGVKAILPNQSCKLTNIEQQQLDKAVRFCKDALGLELDEFELIVCDTLGDRSNLGRADIQNGKMYISRQCFKQGTKMVVFAILEEYTHCKHEVYDETLEQKWCYLEMIASLGEQLFGEPI